MPVPNGGSAFVRSTDDLPPGRLECDISESALFESEQASLAVLQWLREIEVRIVLDDFGTGYYGLSRLRQLPIHKIKIDRTFDRTPPKAQPAPPSSDHHRAHQPARIAVAEGIETEDQWRWWPAPLAPRRRASCSAGRSPSPKPPHWPMRATAAAGAGGLVWPTVTTRRAQLRK